MNCGNCGTLLPANAAHCPNCGAATPNYYSFSATMPNDPTVVTPPYGAEQQIPPTVVTEPYSAGPQMPPTMYGGSQPYQATPPPSTPYNPYNPSTPYPYTPYPAEPLTPVPTPPQRRGNRIGIIIGVAALVLLIVGGSIFGLLRLGSHNLSTKVTPTVNAAATVHANATATAAVEDPYTHSGTLTLADPLSDNSKGNGWDVNSNCAFIDGTYHAIAPNPSYGDYCIARSTDFSNLVFEAQMKIIKGDQGGIDFRVTSTTYPNDQYYSFIIGQDGSYELDIYSTSNSIKALAFGTNSAIERGLDQNNLVAVVAQGSLIKLYVNHQLITSVTNSTYSHGQIGFDVDPFTTNGHPTEVAFSNARVWKL